MAIAGLVADELKLELYDDRRLEEEATKLGIQPEDLRELDEKAPGLFSRILSIKPRVYLDLLQAVVYEVARGGQGIILGHGSQVLLRDFGCALHVRIHASESSRIESLMKERGLSREAAGKLIRKTDHERRGFLQFAFHKDWKDPSLYDVVVNRDKLSTGLAAQIIIQAARSQEIKECSLTALESMEKLSLARRIEAAVLENRQIHDAFRPDILNIEVPEKGTVRITGVAHAEDAKERLVEVVRGVPGVAKVKAEIVVVPSSAE
jgi:cytidylate kinase